MDGPPPHSRQQLYQLWWHQRLFDDKLILQFGKLNGSGIFGNVQIPVAISDPRLQDHDITNLLFVPVGLNPTLFGRLPAYPNTGYGAVVHYTPTKNIYVSYGLFDANGVHGVQTGLDVGPGINTYKLHIGELGYSWLVGEERKSGRVGVGGWWQTGELYTPSLTTENGATGFYLFANQRLWYQHPDVDEAGLIGYLQFSHTDADTQVVKTYFGAGLTGLRLVPGRPADQISLGTAWSWLNDMPGAGAFFYPDVSSESKDLGKSEFMFQVTYQTTFFFKAPRGFWSLSPVIGYTCIPNPGQRPDLPVAHVLSVRLVTLF
jgi:porin